MTQGDFAEPIKLGPPGSEMELTKANFAFPVMPFTENMGRKEAQQFNIIAEGFTEVFAQYTPRFTLNLKGTDSLTRDAVRAIYAVADTHLSFLYAQDWRLISERYLMDTTNEFTLRTNPYQRLDELYGQLSLGPIISNFKVFTTRDMRGLQTTPDLFTGGSYNRVSRLITLGTSPGPSGTPVFVNYTYIGCLVKIAKAPRSAVLKAFTNGQRAWVIPLQLRSV